MTAGAEHGFSAPPEVVFSTATDPDRASAWLPAPVRQASVLADTRTDPGGLLQASWRVPGDSGWSVLLRVEPEGAGSAWARLDLHGNRPEPDLLGIARESLTRLESAVTDNLTAG